VMKSRKKKVAKNKMEVPSCILTAFGQREAT